MNNPKFPLWLLASIALTLIAATYSSFQRNVVESENRTVALATEFDTVQSLAASQGVTVADAIKELKGQGLTAIVLTEDNIADMANIGRLTFESSVWRDPAAGTQTQLANLVFNDPSQQGRVERGLRIRFQNLAGALTTRNDRLNLPPVSTNLIRSTAIGLNPDEVKIAKDNGLTIIGRFGNPNGLSETGVRETFKWAKELGATIYLPLGDQVVGRKDSIEATIDSLRADGIYYAAPEFAKIGGDDTIEHEAPDRVLRLHSAQVAELDKLSLVDAIDRYARAARERNMRVLLLRPVTLASPEPLSSFGSFIADVANRVQKEGGTIGTPEGFKPPAIPKFMAMVIALCAMPMVWFVAAQFVASAILRRVGAGLLLLIGLAAYTKTGTAAAAFLISLAFPAAGYVILERFRPKSVVASFLIISGLSLLGGMCIAGMLNGLTYYIQADEFRGVKLSVFLPVVIIGAYFFTRLVDWKKTMTSPITWGTAALGMAILIVLGIVVARSGNDTGAGASDTELLFRNVLDRVLYVRPRTKEFLVGHPLLIVGIGMLGLYWKRSASDPEGDKTKVIGAWTTMVLMVSAIGQTSIVNTLCHAHIPVVLSLVRVVSGVVLGCIIGYVLWAIVQRTRFVKEI